MKEVGTRISFGIRSAILALASFSSKQTHLQNMTLTSDVISQSTLLNEVYRPTGVYLPRTYKSNETWQRERQTYTHTYTHTQITKKYHRANNVSTTAFLWNTTISIELCVRIKCEQLKQPWLMSLSSMAFYSCTTLRRPTLVVQACRGLTTGISWRNHQVVWSAVNSATVVGGPLSVDAVERPSPRSVRALNAAQSNGVVRLSY